LDQRKRSISSTGKGAAAASSSGTMEKQASLALKNELARLKILSGPLYISFR